MTLTVVIPTFDRADVLARCLRDLLSQIRANPDWRILVVDDGSHDGTPQVIADAQKCLPQQVRSLRQENRGPAAARNLGLREARTDLVLFLGDDIIAAPDLLNEHILSHRAYPREAVSVLGYVTWSPEIKVTPFMRWLENGGPQFRYHQISDPDNVPWTYLYTANFSFKRRFLLENGLFDEEFPFAAYEDSDLARRLAARGMRMVYNPRAIGYHHHPTSLGQALSRMEKVGYSYGIYRMKAGTDNGFTRGRPSLLRRALGEVKFAVWRPAGFLLEDRAVAPGVYDYLMDKARSRGFDRDVQANYDSRSQS